MIIFGNKFTLMVILDTVIEFLGLLPSLLYVGLLFWLDVLVFLAQKLLVIPAFFDYLVQMIFLVFDRFLQFGTNNSLLSVSPLHKLPLYCLNPRLLLTLPLQLHPHLLLLLYIKRQLLSRSMATWSFNSGSTGSVTIKLLDFIFSIECLLSPMVK